MDDKNRPVPEGLLLVTREVYRILPDILIDKNWLSNEFSIRKMGSDVKKKRPQNFWDRLLSILEKPQGIPPPSILQEPQAL